MAEDSKQEQSLTRGAQMVSAARSDLKSQLDALQGKLGGISSQWIGGGSTAFHQLMVRWQDDSMGSNFLFDWSGINQAFASGKVAMYMSGSDVVGSLMQANGFDQDKYGVTTFPLASSSSAGILSGGNVDVVNVKDSPAQVAAAVKWIDFYRTQPTVDKAAAVNNAKTLAAGKQAVGAPTLPVFDKATWEQNQEWIKPYVNVPQANVKPFTDGIFDQKIVPEPASHTQDLYAALDPVVQAVLTDRNADIDALLKGVDTKVQALVDADSK